MQLPTQSPLSPYVHFQGYARLCWGLLFHRLSYFTAPVPCRRCSVSTFSRGWLTTPSLLLLLLPRRRAATLRLPWQKFSFNSPHRSAPSHKNLLSHWTPLSSPRLSLPPSPCPTRPHAPPRCVQLLKNNRCSRVCRGRAVWWELCPSWLQTVIGAPGLTPTDPSPHLRTPAPRCLPSGSLCTCAICGRSSLLQFKPSLECPSHWPVQFQLIQPTVTVFILIKALFALTVMFCLSGWTHSRLVATRVTLKTVLLHCCRFQETSDKYWGVSVT